MTWLRAIFLSAESLSFGSSGFLGPFDPVASDPVPVTAVTEPSQIPDVSPPPPATLMTIDQGEFEPTDVNQDGVTTARDALMVINYVARAQNSAAAAEQVLGDAVGNIDVNKNGTVEPSDALMVINQLARQSAFPGQGEGESRGRVVPDWIPAVDSVFGSGSFDFDDEDEFLDALRRLY